MQICEAFKYGQSKPYREFECPACRVDLHHTGCCCEVRPAIIPTNNSSRSIASLLAIPKTLQEYLSDAHASRGNHGTTEDKEGHTDNKQAATDNSQQLTDEERCFQDSDDDITDKEEDIHDSEDEDLDDDHIIANYRRNISSKTKEHNATYIEKKTARSAWFSHQSPDGASLITTNRPVVYDIGPIPQPGFTPVMRLRAAFPRINDLKGWDCRVVGGHLAEIVDPVCGQCVYDLTRYRWFKNKYDEIEPLWIDHNIHDPNIQADLPGGSLNRLPGISWKLAVQGVYLTAGKDENGWVTKPSWGRWPKELAFMLKARDWTLGVDFLDWKKACQNPDPLEPESERDWVPSEDFRRNGLMMSDMEGMGEYPDWEEMLEQPEWQARGISKVPRNHWNDGPSHILNRWLEGYGKVIFQTDRFSYTARHTHEEYVSVVQEGLELQGPAWF